MKVPGERTATQGRRRKIRVAEREVRKVVRKENSRTHGFNWCDQFCCNKRRSAFSIWKDMGVLFRCFKREQKGRMFLEL